MCLLVGALLVSCNTVLLQAPAAQRTPLSASRSPAKELPVPPADPSAVPVPPAPWVVGATPLLRRPDGYGVVRSTPQALVDRRLPTVDRLPPPTSTTFQSTVGPVPPAVLARSSWRPECPVKPEQLRYLTMSFRGFDTRVHTGEMLVNATVAQTVVGVFKRLFASGFPIEDMRVTPAATLNLPPTGDGNNTEGFLCRPARGHTNWSQHAYGLAIDLNPFQNPYVKDDLVVPELASSYLDRDRVRPGMTRDGDPAVVAFESVGWKWGGRWDGPVDFMHFSPSGH
jgi:hypothetical protein